jgi:hypothetical protein
MKELVDFALTYETIRPDTETKLRAREDYNNRDIGSSMSMNIDYINKELESPNILGSI